MCFIVIRWIEASTNRVKSERSLSAIRWEQKEPVREAVDPENVPDLALCAVGLLAHADVGVGTEAGLAQDGLGRPRADWPVSHAEPGAKKRKDGRSRWIHDRRHLRAGRGGSEVSSSRGGGVSCRAKWMGLAKQAH